MHQDLPNSDSAWNEDGGMGNVKLLFHRTDLSQSDRFTHTKVLKMNLKVL